MLLSISFFVYLFRFVLIYLLWEALYFFFMFFFFFFYKLTILFFSRYIFRHQFSLLRKLYSPIVLPIYIFLHVLLLLYKLTHISHSLSFSRLTSYQTPIFLPSLTFFLFFTNSPIFLPLPFLRLLSYQTLIILLHHSPPSSHWPSNLAWQTRLISITITYWPRTSPQQTQVTN